MVLWIKPVVIALTSLGGLHTAVKVNEQKIDRFFMRIFRDLGRYKARKRRFQQSKDQHGLVSMLMQKDDPMNDLISDAESEDESNLPTYTRAELYEFGSNDNDNEDDNILISIYERVYDVSKGSKYYGPDGPYSLFAGHDITYALATGCRTDDCVDTKADFETLSNKEQDEGKRWLSFFHLHDKYPLVGKLEGSGEEFETLLSKLIDEKLQQEAEAGDGIEPNIQTNQTLNVF